MVHAAQLNPGTVLGSDFRIERMLGHGGMGAIYVAQQLSTGKARAVKVMHASLVSAPGLRERFAQEARIGSLIPSDHVVEVVGAGVDPGLGVPWLAMELLNGEDLARHVARRGPIPQAELPDVLRPVFHALAAAHARGIVHRDIKPENIFLATTLSSTSSMVVKVLDFGIAKVAAQALTAATSALGTPLWMAPEQTEQQSQISPAADVWALGLLAFWALVGKPYWRTAQGESGSVPQLMREVLFEPVIAPSQRARELGFDLVLPAGFDAWFLRCLERSPDRRFATAAEAGIELFERVLGVSPQGIAHTVIPHTVIPQTRPSAGLPPVPPAPSPGSATAVPTVVPARERRSSGAVFIALGGVLLLVGLLVMAGGAGLYFLALQSDDDTAVATAPAPLPEEPEPEVAAGEPVAPEPVATAPIPSPVPRTTHKPGNTAAPTAPTTSSAPVPPAKPAYKVGQKVDVLWSGSWWQGQIIGAKNETYLVHYIGWSSSWDEWVTSARLRPWTGSARTK